MMEFRMKNPGLSVLLLASAALAGAALYSARSTAEASHLTPIAAVDEPLAKAPGKETIVLAGGCFWGVQGVFQHVKGVVNAVSGYAGGEKSTAEYETVSTGTTGHAESVRVTYDPSQVTLGQILRVYFSVAHDPTELNHQGPDSGTQYRSAIFPRDPEQARIAKAHIAEINQARVYGAALVTKIEPGREFYPAEGYHQDYLTLHPEQPYIVYNDLPKVAGLKATLPELYREQPVLVAKAGLSD
jgi:peptide-methionine (S)-S-oxide reductase